MPCGIECDREFGRIVVGRLLLLLLVRVPRANVTVLTQPSFASIPSHVDVAITFPHRLRLPPLSA